MNYRKSLHLILPGTVLLSGGVFLAFAPDQYLPMLARAFMLPAVVLLGLLTLGAWMRRARWTACCAALGALLAGTQVHTTGRVPLAHNDGLPLRVLHMNVWQPNTRYADVVEQALASGADILSIQEVAPRWAEALVMGLGAQYPYHHLEPRTDCYGIALFSRVPLGQVRTITMYGTPFIEAVLEKDGHALRLMSVHATSPTSYGHFRRRNRQLTELGSYLIASPMTTIVVGDLNTVPWDRSFRQFCTTAGLRPTTPPTQRTWPVLGPLALIPLDHVLVSPGITLQSLHTVRIPGSDHKGVLADLNLTAHAH